MTITNLGFFGRSRFAARHIEDFDFYCGPFSGFTPLRVFPSLKKTNSRLLRRVKAPLALGLQPALTRLPRPGFDTVVGRRENGVILKGLGSRLFWEWLGGSLKNLGSNSFLYVSLHNINYRKKYLLINFRFNLPRTKQENFSVPKILPSYKRISIIFI